MTVTVFHSTIVSGDVLNPDDYDIIAQQGRLPVGEPVPDGWRVLTGNMHTSLVVRIALRYEIATK